MINCHLNSACFMKRTHQAIFLALMMATMSLAGCFGGDEKGSDEDETPVETLDDWQVHFANTASDLPECSDDRDGWLYYVSADENFRVCTQFGWELVDITGPSGADGTNGVDGQNGADGTNGVDGQNGADGTNGIDGQNGADGTNGTDGMDGQDGTSILINVVSSTACLNGGNTFEIGSDDDADGVLDVTEVGVTVDICNGADGQDGADGADGAQGPAGADGTNGTDGADGADGTQGPAGADGVDGQDGTDGQDGADGNATLTVTTNLSSASSNCWGDGGVQIDVGVDDNNNGVLESSEIDDTTYICNGGDGADGDSAYQIWLNNGNTGSEQDFLDSLEGSSGTNGTNGTDGQDGSNGLNAIASMTPESAGSNCANGGTRIDVGVDDNSNGVLEASEIDQTQYVCDGGSSNNTMLTSISSPSSNMGCDAGGRVVSHGLDNGDGGGTYANGVLETGEIDSTTTFCSRFVSDDYNLKMVKDISSGSGSSSPNLLTAVGNTLYFRAYRRNQRIRIVEERWNRLRHGDGQGYQQRKWQQLSQPPHSRW